MAISTQDLVHGLDITGLASVTASQIMQVTDAAVPESKRGFVLTTTDTAPNVPEVPNAAVTTKFKRYLWRRVLTDNTAKLYFWKDSLVSDVTYLKWEEINAELSTIEAEVATALDDSATALTNANNALSTSQTAQTIAQSALDAANKAQSDVDALKGTVENLQESIVDSVFSTGDIRANAGALSYSTSADEGWLKCDGSAVNRIVFSRLFNAIGTIYGAGDGVTTFNLPDLRGRTIVGAGLGAGLTDRALATSFGEETHQLSMEEMNHFHGVGNANYVGVDLRIIKRDWNTVTVQGNGMHNLDTTAPPTSSAAENSGILGSSDPLDTGVAVVPHGNMQPSVALNYYIRT